jgi:hypothetical protein
MCEALGSSVPSSTKCHREQVSRGVRYIKAEGSSSQYIKGEFRSIQANTVSNQEQEERGEKTQKQQYL